MKSILPESVCQLILILTIKIITLTFTFCTAEIADGLKDKFKSPPSGLFGSVNILVND